MKRQNKLWLALLLSVVGLILGLMLINNYELKFCYSDHSTSTYDVGCHDILDRIGVPLYAGAESLAVVFLLLLLVPQALSLWKKFAIWYLPAMLAVFLTYEGPGAFDLFSPYPQQLFQFVSGVYVVVSALIVLWVFTHSKITKRVPTVSPVLKNPLLKFLWFVYIGVLVLNVLWVVTA